VRIRKIKKPFAKGLFPKLRIISLSCDGMDEIDFGRCTMMATQGLNLNVFKKIIRSNRGNDN
jgi:hypothetical protein